MIIDKTVLKVTLKIINKGELEKIELINSKRRVNFVPDTKTLYLISDNHENFIIYNETEKSTKRVKKKEFIMNKNISAISKDNIVDFVDFMNKIYIRPNAKLASTNEVRFGVIEPIASLLYISDDYVLKNVESISPNSIIGVVLRNTLIEDMLKGIDYKTIKFANFGIEWNKLRNNIEVSSEGTATLLDRYTVHNKVKVYCVHIKGGFRSVIPVILYLSYSKDDQLVYSMSNQTADKVGQLALSFEFVHCKLMNRLNINNINTFKIHENELMFKDKLVPVYATPILE